MKKSFWLSFPISALAIALALTLRSLLAKDFNKDELGFYYAALDAVYFAVLPFLGFRATMTIYFARGETFAQNSLRQRYAMMIAFVPAFLISIFLAKILGANVSSAVMFILLFIVMISVYFNNQLGMIRAYSAINAVSFIEPIAPLILYLALKPTNANEMLTLSSAAFLIPAIFAAIYVWRKGYIEPKFERINFNNSKAFYKDSLFASLEFGFGMATLFAASFIAAHHILALSDFQVVIKPVLMFTLTLFVFPILRYIAPEIAKTIGENNLKGYLDLKKFIIRYAFGAFLLISVCLIWRQELVIALFSEKYLASADALIFMSSATLFAILNTFSLATLKALNSFELSFYIRVVGFCFFLLGYFWITTLIELSLWLALSHFAMWLASRLSVSRLFETI